MEDTASACRNSISGDDLVCTATWVGLGIISGLQPDAYIFHAVVGYSCILVVIEQNPTTPEINSGSGIIGTHVADLIIGNGMSGGSYACGIIIQGHSEVGQILNDVVGYGQVVDSGLVYRHPFGRVDIGAVGAAVTAGD